MTNAYDIDGQSRLVLTDDNPDPEGKYQVDIGADAASLDAVASPTADAPYWVWRVIPGSRLQLQSATSLVSSDWQDEGDSFTVFEDTWKLEESFDGTEPRFYRLLWVR